MSDTFSIPPPSLNGLRLNGFVITGTLSGGGMGVVYEARHQLLGLRAAVKLIRPELCDREDLAARFLREALALSAVKHRNVVEILDFGSLPGGAQYMMLEFLEGETLAEIIAREAPMKPAAALQICSEILAGLDAAHHVGVVHRDLKPSNIILMKQSSGELSVKVLDFGLARLVGSPFEVPAAEQVRPRTPERSSLVAGTPEYISPEVASFEQAGAQADLYSMGVILFEMLSGRLPFTGSSAGELIEQHRHVPAPSLRQTLPRIDPLLDMFVRRLLQKNPGDRPIGAKEAAKEAEFLLSRCSVPRPRALPRTRTVAIAAGALAACLLAIGLTTSSAVPPAAPRRAILLDELVVSVEADPPPRPAPTLPSRPRPAPVANACEVTPGWRRAIRDQYEDLEKLSLARMTDEATAADVARIRQRVRGLATQVKRAQGNQCQAVEADLEAWRTALR